ncbi:hypothetical protein HanRHA438_Chr05g0205451 [Helianthus annuus]|uniref:Organ specific protein n=1 Tax=Helianthus annuus TaxID=4232 RepID=A0A251UMQ4_HELAN|nr:hypothetical protein HanXRQr2_Chr05g0195791 [Helianthus annuus]KAJ0568978.1 hypothetical protein HanHA300_Chr05g0160861 [Helianthus annuus]KAJ0575316.1 hypothetical protein HanIR_Chr05g0211391 [Helianthus annuus]KAJ0583258.1 hypothetical protein HanHA89_Chr05g0174551 [Helianthus annuus]KAJ0745993.1 hypothetical protein HanOQP8_Chr05g0172461 [Helianthus annuus]
MKGGFVCCILLLILGFIFSSSTDASRDSQWMVSLPEIHFQNKIDPTNDKENMGYVESTTRRLDLENMDYGGTGANDRHDPKSPGRA